MPDTAVVIVDAHEESSLTDTKQKHISDLVKRAESSGEALFYVLPDGEDIPESVATANAFSILRYNPERDSAYDHARVDEQITGRDIDRTQIFSVTAKGSEFSQREKSRGRDAYAGSPASKNAPDWAGPPAKTDGGK